MDVTYINPFLKAIQSVFGTMLGIPVGMGKPALKTNNGASSDVTGVVGMAGDRQVTVAVSFDSHSAISICKLLTGEPVEDFREPNVRDAIGELTNIISGQARKELEAGGISLKASIPVVEVGRDVELSFLTKRPIISLPLSFDIEGSKGEAYIEFCVE